MVTRLLKTRKRATGRKHSFGTRAIDTLIKYTHKRFNWILSKSFESVDSFGFNLDTSTYTTVYSTQYKPLFSKQYHERAKCYRVFRIPVIVSVQIRKSLVLFAFAEAREGVMDTGSIDIVCRRSFDSGRSWEEGVVVATHSQLQLPKQPNHINTDNTEGTCGNPCIVTDYARQQLVMVFCHNHASDIESSIRRGHGSRTVWVTRCPFKSATNRSEWLHSHVWTKPVNISAQVKRPHWTWYATGPGIGVSLALARKKKSRLRLIVPCNHSTLNHGTGEIGHGAHLIYSDDGGTHWSLGACFDGTDLEKHGLGLNESQAAIVNVGKSTHLLLNCRSFDNEIIRAQKVQNRRVVNDSRWSRTLLPSSPSEYVRRIGVSIDGGTSFTSLMQIPQHNDVANCQVGFITAMTPKKGIDTRYMWFSNPSSKDGRRTMRLRLVPLVTYDPLYKSSSVSKAVERSIILRKGASGYSSLCPLTPRAVGILFEAGTWLPGISSQFTPAITYQAIVFRVVQEYELIQTKKLDHLT